MAKRILDTSFLITHWKRRGGQSPKDKTASDAKAWALELITIHNTNAIVTPVYLEVLVGVTNSNEMNLTRTYLSEFKIIDDGKITPKDWEKACQIAGRIPQSGKRRQLGDCLIAAISDRLKYEVLTMDGGFPR
jgi:predicted nucleic acid-binding protein